MKTATEILILEPADLKKKTMELAAEELREFLYIIGEIGLLGYQVYKYNHQGRSLKECGIKFRMSKRRAQIIINKCNENGYGHALIKLKMLK